MKTLNLVVGIVLVSVGFYLLISAMCCQQRVDANNEFLKMNKSMPSLYYDYIVSFNASMKVIIPLYISLGIIFIIVAGCLCFHPKVKILALLFLLSLCMLNFPTALAATGSERWYAELLLQQPRNAEAIEGKIYVYDNYLDDVYSFVAFRIALIRIDVAWKQMEWLEAGYFENRSGFWIYAASCTLAKGYIENDWVKLAGEGSNGEGYLTFVIEQVDTNTFWANVFPRKDIGILMAVTFNIGGDNLYMGGSESNDPANSLNGHYADLLYRKNDNWYDWADVSTKADSPYSVAMGSTNEFFTDGTMDLDDLYIIALAFGSKPGDSNWNSNADLTRDNVVDVLDLRVAALHFGED